MQAALRVFISVLIVVVALGTLVELWGPKYERFFNLGWSDDESVPSARHVSAYGLLNYLSRQETVYGGRGGVVTQTTFSPIGICANALATMAIAGLSLVLLRRALSLPLLARPGVMTLAFAGVGFILPLTLLTVDRLTPGGGWWPSSTFLVWPTAHMFVATGAFNIVNTFWYEIAAISIGINATIYAAIGFVVSLAVREIRVAV